jgi:hypothetical protein
MSMNKQIALYDLITSYMDSYGGVTLTNKNLSNPLDGIRDNENSHLFTGQAALLIHLNNLTESIYFAKFADNVSWHLTLNQVVPGLFTRFPDPYRFSDGHHGISFDEMAGIAFQALIINRRDILDDIVTYGKNHNWAFIDEEPGADPIKMAGGDLKSAIKKIIKVFKSGDAKLARKEHDVVDYLSRVRQPRERAFYKLLSTKFKPSYFELLNMYFGLIGSSFGEANDTSTKIIGFYKIISLDMIGHKSLLYKLTKFIFKRRMHKLYGDCTLNALTMIYFKDVNHPFHRLTEDL